MGYPKLLSLHVEYLNCFYRINILPKTKNIMSEHQTAYRALKSTHNHAFYAICIKLVI